MLYALKGVTVPLFPPLTISFLIPFFRLLSTASKTLREERSKLFY